MLKSVLMLLAVIMCATRANASMQCNKERFEFRGTISDHSLFYFENLPNGELAFGPVPDVARTARVCAKDEPNICLDFGREFGPFFMIPKAVLFNKNKPHEWQGGDYIFRLSFDDEDVYIIDSYLVKAPDQQRFSFYYSVKAGLLAIVYLGGQQKGGKKTHIIETYVSTCPGFLSLSSQPSTRR